MLKKRSVNFLVLWVNKNEQNSWIKYAKNIGFIKSWFYYWPPKQGEVWDELKMLKYSEHYVMVSKISGLLWHFSHLQYSFILLHTAVLWTLSLASGCSF